MKNNLSNECFIVAITEKDSHAINQLHHDKCISDM